MSDVLKTRMMGYQAERKFDDISDHFDITHECDGRTDGQTD